MCVLLQRKPGKGYPLRREIFWSRFCHFSQFAEGSLFFSFSLSLSLLTTCLILYLPIKRLCSCANRIEIVCVSPPITKTFKVLSRIIVPVIVIMERLACCLPFSLSKNSALYHDVSCLYSDVILFRETATSLVSFRFLEGSARIHSIIKVQNFFFANKNYFSIFLITFFFF